MYRMYESCPGNVTKILKTFMEATYTGIDVRTSVLTGKNIHTWIGMIGYCLKDIGLPHFRIVEHNISDQEKEQGKEEYAKHGSGLLKKKTAITGNNIIQQMLVFQYFSYPDVRISPVRMLAAMMRSGNYYPCASWAMTAFGKGLHKDKFAAIWKTLTDPE